MWRVWCRSQLAKLPATTSFSQNRCQFFMPNLNSLAHKKSKQNHFWDLTFNTIDPSLFLQEFHYLHIFVFQTPESSQLSFVSSLTTKHTEWVISERLKAIFVLFHSMWLRPTYYVLRIHQRFFNLLCSIFYLLADVGIHVMQYFLHSSDLDAISLSNIYRVIVSDSVSQGRR